MPSLVLVRLEKLAVKLLCTNLSHCQRQPANYLSLLSLLHVYMLIVLHPAQSERRYPRTELGGPRCQLGKAYKRIMIYPFSCLPFRMERIVCGGHMTCSKR